MGILEYHQGCNVRPENCMGPWDNYYTLFGTELQFLDLHAIVAIIFCTVVLLILWRFKNKGALSTPWVILAPLVLIVGILLFLLLAFLFPVRVYY